MKQLELKRIFRCGTWLAVVAWVSTVAAVADGGTEVGSIELEPCHIDNYRQEVLCGSHRVPENRGAAEQESETGRHIEIHFAVLPAVDETADPDPLVLFAGGPGQAAMDMAPIAGAFFRPVNENRDIVLIDQRGMGRSHPLECAELEDDAVLRLSTAEQHRLAREVLTRCLDDLDADVTQYTQDVANADIHEILRGLGYTEVNLYGVSWGTRSALLYAHRYPQHVRSIVLDGALPLENRAPMHAAADADRALQALFDDCAADVRCQKAFPSLPEDFRSVLEQLGDEGLSVEWLDATTGEPQTVLLTIDSFGDALRSVLYVPELSRALPLIIHQASSGDFRALNGVFGYLSQATGGGMTVGASLTIFCSEELARMPQEAVLHEAPSAVASVPDDAMGRLGEGILNNLKNACSVWPKAPLPAIYRQDVGSDAPTLILSGEVDPITPPAWGDAMQKLLPRSQHLVAAATGHNVAPRGCAPLLIDQWIDQGTDEPVDGGCLEQLQRPSFFVDLSGPGAAKVEREQ